MGPLEVTVLVVAFGGLVAWVLRAMQGGRDEVVRPPSTSVREWDPVLENEDDDDPDADDQVAVMTSDGWAFVPMGEGVRLVPPRVPAEAFQAMDVQARGAIAASPPLDVGDLIAARVMRGAPDHDPWRVEALGRDRDLRTWRFETEEAARAAHMLLSTRIVRAPVDEYGEPMALGDEDFASALREQDEIERELAMDLGPETEEGGGRFS